MLQYAGTAIKALSVPTLESDGQHDNEAQDTEQRKANFATASSQYFATLSSIDVRLRRHIVALEDSGILPSEAVIQDSQSINTQAEFKSSQQQPARLKSTITNGGLGNMDIGWLNSRNDKIEKTMEAELWQQAHDLVQKTLKSKVKSEGDDDAAMSNNKSTTT